MKLKDRHCYSALCILLWWSLERLHSLCHTHTQFPSLVAMRNKKKRHFLYGSVVWLLMRTSHCAYLHQMWGYTHWHQWGPAKPANPSPGNTRACCTANWNTARSTSDWNCRPDMKNVMRGSSEAFSTHSKQISKGSCEYGNMLSICSHFCFYAFCADSLTNSVVTCTNS